MAPEGCLGRRRAGSASYKRPYSDIPDPGDPSPLSWSSDSLQTFRVVGSASRPTQMGHIDSLVQDTTVLIPGESRNWIKYSPGMLLVALLGRIILGFGTRLGPGCTTHHIFGGLAVMSVASLTIAMVGMSFAFLAFEFVAKLGRFHRNEAYQRCCRAADRCDTECDTESMVFGTESCKILRIVHA